MTKVTQRGSTVTVVSILIVILTLGYWLIYSPYVAQKEEAARLAAEEARRVADEARRAAEQATKKAAEEKARILEKQTRAAEERARIAQAQAQAQGRAADERAQQVEAKMRTYQHETPPECKFRYFTVGDDKGQVLATNAKQECIRNKVLKESGQASAVTYEAYTLWKDHFGVEGDRRNQALNRANAANRANQSIKCTPDFFTRGGFECK